MHDLIRENFSKIELAMRLVDVWILVAAGHLASTLHSGRGLDEAGAIHVLLLYFCSALAFLLFAQADLYGSLRGRPFWAMCRRVALNWATVLLIGLVVSFMAHRAGELSRLWLCYWFVVALCGLLVFRWAVHTVLRYLRKKGYNTKNVVIIGYGDTGQSMHRRALAHKWSGYEVQGVCPVDHAIPTAADLPPPRRVLELDSLRSYLATHQVDEIWIALPMHCSDKLPVLQHLLGDALVDIRWIPDVQQLQLLSNSIGDFLGFPAVDLNQPTTCGLRGLSKELFDRLFAIGALLALSPLMAAIAVAIKFTSPGPVFFRQARHGLNGKTFYVYKFRSMHVQNDDGVAQATRNDPRVTRLGQFLRRTSLDELPQFINVLLGDMSVVGPRPHALQHNDLYRTLLDRYMLRHRVKPGITGWAQIHGYRGETDSVDKMAMRIQFDLYYIRNWSLWLDCRIIAWTTYKGWTGKNAY